MNRRVVEHNNCIGCKYTRSRVPVTLIWSTPVFGRSLAQKLEAGVKKMPREQKLVLASDGVDVLLERWLG